MATGTNGPWPALIAGHCGDVRTSRRKQRGVATDGRGRFQRRGPVTSLQLCLANRSERQLYRADRDADERYLGHRHRHAAHDSQLDAGNRRRSSSLSLFDTQNTAAITSTQVVSDGQWHHIAAVRSAATRQLRLYIDHVEAAAVVVDTATFVTPTNATPDPIDPMYLGVYNTLNANNKLAMVVDTLKFTAQGAGAAAVPLTSGVAVPSPPPPPEVPTNAPTSIVGLQLWLPAYDPTRFFSDHEQVPRCRWCRCDGMATRWIMQRSTNELRIRP